MPPTNKIFEALVPLVSPLLKKKKHIRLGHAGIADHSVDLSIPDLKKKYKKRNGQNQWKIRQYYITAEQQLPVPYGSMLHIPPTNLLLLAAKEEPYKKAYFLTKNIEEFSEKSVEE